MNKNLVNLIVIAVVVVVFSVVGMLMGRHSKNQLVELTVEVCHESADIEIAKCQSYENGCINPKVLINVVSDNPGAKATVRGGSGFYILRDHHHSPKIIHLDEGETIYETFGCEYDKKE